MEKWELNAKDIDKVMVFLKDAREMKGSAVSKYEYFTKNWKIYSDLYDYIHDYNAKSFERTLMLLKALDGQVEPVLLRRYVLFWEFPPLGVSGDFKHVYVKVGDDGKTIMPVESVGEATCFKSKEECKPFMNSYMEIEETNYYY